MSTFRISSLLEKRRERTRQPVSAETFSNFWTRLKACPRKFLLPEYGLVTGFVKQCAVVKSIHHEFIVQLVYYINGYINIQNLLFCSLKKFQTHAGKTVTCHDVSPWCAISATVGNDCVNNY